MNILKFAVQQNLDGVTSQEETEEVSSSEATPLTDAGKKDSNSNTPNTKPVCTNPDCTRSRPNSNVGNKCVCTQQHEQQQQQQQQEKAPSCEPGTAEAAGSDGKSGKKAGEESGGGKASESQSKCEFCFVCILFTVVYVLDERL